MLRKSARNALGWVLLCVWVGSVGASAQTATPPDRETKSFRWPEGKRAAVSLTFDDARLSQIDTGLAVLDRCRVKATFYVTSGNIEERLAGWKKAAARGHEIANHSRSHPCSGTFAFSRQNALEEYTLEVMAKELDAASAEIERLLGVRPTTFAYPCGQRFVGRGREVKSYVPLVAERFLLGRGYFDEAANDPAFSDLAQAAGTAFDDMGFEQMGKLVAEAARDGRWLIFVGHEIGEKGFQITDACALEALCKYLRDPANGFWVDTVEKIAKYVVEHRAPGQK